MTKFGHFLRWAMSTFRYSFNNTLKFKFISMENTQNRFKLIRNFITKIKIYNIYIETHSEYKNVIVHELFGQPIWFCFLTMLFLHNNSRLLCSKQ